MFANWILVSLAVPLVAGYLVSPPGTPYPEASSDCSGWVEYTSGLTCANVEETYSITDAQFVAWNPLVSLSGTCSVASGFCYCVQINFESTITSSTSSTIGVTTTTSSSSTATISSSSISSYSTTTGASTTATSNNGITTPTPIQSGIVDDCDAFYLVASGDSCQSIATSGEIALADFYTWNPAVGSSCSSLWLGYYVCTGIIGDSTITAKSATTTTALNSISTPTPVQTGMVSSCDGFYRVESDDTCQAISTASGISLSDFYAWNPAVGSSCASLTAGDYVCVRIAGYTSPSSSTISATTTIPGNGIPTPSPIQSGMVTDCEQFHFVVSGDSCTTIASGAGISVTDFYTWNPTVGSSCSSLWLGYYVCIDVIGYTPSQTTTTILKTTTTSKGNGITTPTPTQVGMVTDCNNFYLVGTGDSCAAIASEEGVTLAQIESWNSGVGSGCTDLWLGYYICVGV